MVKIALFFLVDLLFPLLQGNGPDPGPGGQEVPIIQFIALLISAGVWLGIRSSKKTKKY